MATATLQPQPVPETTKSSMSASNNGPELTVLDEVRAAHKTLRTRLQGALNQPPPDSDSSLLPTVPLIDLGATLDSTDPDTLRNARAKCASEIRAACLTTGFFQIANHGVPDSIQQGILEQAKRFIFELSDEQKDELHIRHSEYFRGYEPGASSYTGDDHDANDDVNGASPATDIDGEKSGLGSAGTHATTNGAHLASASVNTNANTNDTTTNGHSSSAETTINTVPESKEAFNFGYEPGLDTFSLTDNSKYVELDGSVPPKHLTTYANHPGTKVSRQHGHNVWPAEADLPGFYEAVAAYYGHMLKLARHLFGLFAESLGLEESWFESVTRHPGGIGRLIYYPPGPVEDDGGDKEAGATNGHANGTPSTPSEDLTTLGLGAHTDYECFTLLLSSPTPGLEILFPPSPSTANLPLWQPCPIRAGTLTVNVADFLQRWTGGLYKSTIHRVVTHKGVGERVSVPFFYSIDYDELVGELPVKLDGVDGVNGLEEKKRYAPMKAGEYVLERLRATRVVEKEEEERQKAQ